MISKLLKLVLLAAVVALAAGAYVGTRLPYGDTHLRTTDATATLENRRGLADAEEKGGDRQFRFHVQSVHWSDGSDSGQGQPPCLRTVGTTVEVELGFTSVATPDGSTYDSQVLWVRCP